MEVLVVNDQYSFFKRLILDIKYRGVLMVFFVLIIIISFATSQALWGNQSRRVNYFISMLAVLVLLLIKVFYLSLKTSKKALRELKVDEFSVYISYITWNRRKDIELNRENFKYLEYYSGRYQSPQIRFYDDDRLLFVSYYVGNKGDQTVKEICGILKSKGFKKPYGHNL